MFVRWSHNDGDRGAISEECVVGTKYVSSAKEWIGEASNKSRLNRIRSSVEEKSGRESERFVCCVVQLQRGCRA